ncbi:PREDICTED: importin-11 isoform X2 [Ceratosolen solmsi marchali]|uniref:Importin-11 isoform X2 n=1 Tax=Ceratosolen solmsi marchali TaxID=326594 RepID=A0AAJ6YQE9_9HYME|nr:PREDICTED: importin-11 isoform X2 [Ceratosolen solmsi marchali]
MDRTIIEILEQAGSQDPTTLKIAEQMLRQWETQYGFYTALFKVFSNNSFTINVRWIAVLYFKNGVDRYWRKHAPGEIALDEKEFLRQALIAKFDEPVNQLAIQVAVLIAKIARFDCPKEWNSLVPTLLEVIRGNNSLAQHRALLTFHHVIKALASKRLIADRRIFQELTLNIFNFILDIWNNYTESFILLILSGANDHPLQEAIQKALLSLKILGKLIIHGFPKPSENQRAMLFLKMIFDRIRTILDCRKNFMSRGLEVEIFDKFIIHLTKILQGVLEIHPFCYVDLIPTTLECSVFYCFTEIGQSLVFERFIIQCLNLFKEILQTNVYKPAKVIQETKNLLTLRAHQLKQEFFTLQILKEICIRLVTHYFVLTSSDLEIWNTDPENFGFDDCGESWKYSLRPCTESVFLALLHQFKDIFSNVLVELMQKHYQPVHPNDFRGILLKDAVYNAVGLAGFDLYDEVNFDQWFSTTLKLELNDKSNNYRIIRRRVCWLIGRWTGVKLSAEYRPELYNLMAQALRPDEDLGVRLAASDALKLAIDDFQFNTDDFIPYLERIFSLLFCLLKEVNECDTKMRVLYVLSFMIERVGNGIKPHISSLNAYLPELWQESKNHNMLRCAILSTLVHLEIALGSDSIMLQPLVIKVIELSCDMNQEEYIYLLEDGLELWQALLQNTPYQTPAIMELFKKLPALLESSTENLKLCVYITEAYVLLNPEELMCERGSGIVESFKSIIGDLRSDGIIIVMQLLELCLITAPQSGSQFIKPLLLKIFESVYEGDEYPMVWTAYLTIVARILLNSRDIFIQIIKELSKRLGQEFKEDFVFAQVINSYIDHMPLVTQHKEKKLLALALCSLLDVNSPSAIFKKFPQIILNIVETLNDITKINDMGCSTDSLMIDHHHSPSQFEDVGYETEHSLRKRRLSDLRKLLGDEQFKLMMLEINPDLDQQLKEYISI